MTQKNPIAVLVAVLLGVSASFAETAPSPVASARVEAVARPFALDMVHHNPGEPEPQSDVSRPRSAQVPGSNGNVPRVFVQCAVTFDSFDPAKPAVGPVNRKITPSFSARLQGS